MGAARNMFDAAKHPRGFHGRFGSGDGGRSGRPTHRRTGRTETYPYPLVATVAATRAWMKAGQPASLVRFEGRDIPIAHKAKRRTTKVQRKTAYRWLV